MEHPSKAWLDKFNETLVPEEFVEISYDSITPGAQESAAPAKTEQLPFGNIENLTKDKDREIVKYATGEPNLFVLDGSFSIPPEKNAKDGGYVSYEFPPDDVSATFSQCPSFAFSFTTGKISKISPGITILWSNNLNEYATDFIIRVTSTWEDEFSSGASTVSKVVNNNKDVYCEIPWDLDLKSEFLANIAVYVLKWSIPNRRARAEWIFFGYQKVYDKNDILSYTHTSSRDPVSGQLSKDCVEFSLDNSDKKWDPINPKGMYTYLYERQPINVRYGMDINGKTEWINGGKYFLSEWNVPSNGLEASFVARDAFEFLMTSNYTGRKVGTLYQMCYDALETFSDVISSFSISNELKEYSADISNESGSYKNSDILQLAANAAGMALYQSRDGTIHIERVSMITESGTEVYDIPGINNYQWPDITFSARVKNVSCNVNGKEYLYPEGTSVSGVTQTVSNELLTEAMLKKSKNSITESYAMLANRKKAELEYRASPHIDAFDHVRINHNFGYMSNLFVTESKYEYSGCFKGTISGYILSDVSSVSISPSSLSLIYGQSEVLSASVSPYSQDLPTISWRTSPDNVVNLHVLTNEAGKSTCSVQYNRKGTATVTAYVGSFSSSVSVRNNSPSLTLSVSSITVRWGATQEIKATFSPVSYAAPQINWSISPAGIAKIEVTQTGTGTSTCKVTWLKKGTATITATAAEESKTCSVTAAASTLDTIPEGTILTLAKGNGTVKVALVKHNYESSLNGNGRNLMLQMAKEELRTWNSYKGGNTRTDDVSDNYDGSEIDTWVNGTWVNNFSQTIRDKMGETAIKTYYTTADYDKEDRKLYHYNAYKSIKRKAFLLSLNELGEYIGNASVPQEGSELPNIVSLYNSAIAPNAAWTRTRLDYDLSNKYSGWGFSSYLPGYSCYRNIIFWAGAYRTDSDYIRCDVNVVTEKEYAIPAFTFPNSVEVDVNGKIML